MKIQIVTVIKLLLGFIVSIFIFFFSLPFIYGQNDIEFRKITNADNRDTILTIEIDRDNEFSFLVIDTISEIDTGVYNNINLTKLLNIADNRLYNPDIKGLVCYYNNFKFKSGTVCVLRSVIKFSNEKSVDLKSGAPPWIYIIPNPQVCDVNTFNSEIFKYREVFRNQNNEKTFYTRIGDYNVLFDLLRDKNLTIDINNISFTYIVNDEFSDINPLRSDSIDDNLVFWIIDKVQSKNSGFMSNVNLKKLYDMSASKEIAENVKGYVYYYNEKTKSKNRNNDTLSIPGIIKFEKVEKYGLETVDPPWIFVCQNENEIKSEILKDIINSDKNEEISGISLYEIIDRDDGNICVFKLDYSHLFALFDERPSYLIDKIRIIKKKDK